MAGSNLVIKLTPLVKSLLPSPANPGLETVSEVRCGTKTDPCRPKKSMKSWLMGRLQCSVSRLEGDRLGLFVIQPTAPGSHSVI
jgi:hypothetical protein